MSSVVHGVIMVLCRMSFTLFVVMMNVIMLGVVRQNVIILFGVKLNVIKLGVIRVNAVMLSVVRLNVMAPSNIASIVSKNAKTRIGQF
jgi:hypothetical protein